MNSNELPMKMKFNKKKEIKINLIFLFKKKTTAKQTKNISVECFI